MIKIKPIDVTIIIDFPAESNTLKPKFMIRDHVRILNYKKKNCFQTFTNQTEWKMCD